MKIKVDLNKNNIIAITIAIIIIVFVIILSNVGTPKTSKIYPTENKKLNIYNIRQNNIFKKIYYIARKLCLPFYALFCLFFPFSQLHSPLCAFKK